VRANAQRFPPLFCFAPRRAIAGVAGMSSTVPPPTQALAELAAVLGDENVRTLVRTFLRDFPNSFREFSRGVHSDRHRLAHSMKSNSRLMGALNISQRMARLESRLATNPNEIVSAEEIAAISAEYEEFAGPLRAFVGE
jgi:HPt (histidine-containing phosphotransfer) domain-containing protein